MNPFQAFAEDDEDDFQTTSTQSKLPKRCFILFMQLIKIGKPPNNRRYKRQRKAPPKLPLPTKMSLRDSRKIKETKNTIKPTFPKMYPLATTLTAEAEQEEAIILVNKEEGEAMWAI